jgi:hypothetical protein
MGRSILWIWVQTNSFKPTERQYSVVYEGMREDKSPQEMRRVG